MLELMESLEQGVLDAYLRDWLVRASGFFVDPSVTFAPDLRCAPLGDAARRVALVGGVWLMIEKDEEPFVLAGIQQRTVRDRPCFAILEYCVTSDSRITFWERRGPGNWDFLRSEAVT
jgi:hypothetical protein